MKWMITMRSRVQETKPLGDFFSSVLASLGGQSYTVHVAHGGGRYLVKIRLHACKLAWTPQLFYKKNIKLFVLVNQYHSNEAPPCLDPSHTVVARHHHASSHTYPRPEALPPPTPKHRSASGSPTPTLRQRRRASGPPPPTPRHRSASRPPSHSRPETPPCQCLDHPHSSLEALSCLETPHPLPEAPRLPHSRPLPTSTLRHLRASSPPETPSCLEGPPLLPRGTVVP
ncbi:hypothetical protein KY285_011051 [Solanum tuberosum]|nr:hypothetical protein KY289_012386 [Solanum tuberosum]KAH0709328.1 hypothetical protein KY284_010755 [Solanum tuberosum]KAH0735344.1 hypothetical protein KY285_011051 [Solanum tuberosum]